MTKIKKKPYHRCLDNNKKKRKCLLLSICVMKSLELSIYLKNSQ